MDRSGADQRDDSGKDAGQAHCVPLPAWTRAARSAARFVPTVCQVTAMPWRPSAETAGSNLGW